MQRKFIRSAVRTSAVVEINVRTAPYLTLDYGTKPNVSVTGENDRFWRDILGFTRAPRRAELPQAYKGACPAGGRGKTVRGDK